MTTRSLAAVSAAALGAGLLYGSVAPSASAADEGQQRSAMSDIAVRASSDTIAGIETVGPIATVPGSDGERWPVLPQGVAVMPRGTVLSGDYPLVSIPALKDTDSVDVRVRELSSPRPATAVVFEGTAEKGWFTVAKALKRGAEYAVEVSAGDGRWSGVGTFNVSPTGDAGTASTIGSLSVSEATGRVSWSWTAPPLAGPAGNVGVSLAWGAGAQTTAGTPEGWRLLASTGSPWMALEESPVDVAAADVPAAPAAVRRGSQITIDFAYPAPETRLVNRFVVAGKPAQGSWRVLARLDRTFAEADVDAILRGRKARDIRTVRVGAVVHGTTVWGPETRVRTSAPAVTSAPRDRHLTGAGSGSLATPGDLPSVVRLVGWDGSLLTFVRNPLGVYEQTGGQVAGFSNGLTWIKEGEWEFAALDGVVTRFVDGRAVSVQVKGAPSASMTWTNDGRLASISNEVGRTMTMRYSGDAACPTWSGFTAAPQGMLCAVSHPGDRVTQIGYVTAGDSSQIALIKDPGNVGETLGWDDRGRLVSVRSSLVNRIATVDPTVAGVVDSLVYDSQGRAATLTEAPARPGGDSLVRRIDFPTVTEAGLREWVASGAQSDAAQVTVRAEGGGYNLMRVKTIDPTTWQPLRVTAPYGLDMSVARDAGSGQPSTSVDPVGRRTTYSYDELGQVTSVFGPVLGGASGSVSSTDYDTKRVSGRDVALSGLRAQVYDRDGYAGAVTAEFWEADYARGGLSYAWKGRGTKFSAQASAVWTPPREDDAAGARDGWDFQVQASGGSDVSLVVGGVVCPVSTTACRVSGLPKGPKSVTVQISDAPSDGWFVVSAAPAGEQPKQVRYDDLRPGYGLTTVSTNNDDLPGGTDVTRTEYSFADPAQAQLSAVKAPGGLVTSLGYEATSQGAGSWGRLLTRGTPGGLTQTTSYWPDRATVSLPSECGSDRVDVSGQPRTITRQDGTTVTSYYDIQGRVRATVSAGGSITHTTCTTYRPDGSVQSASVHIDGALAESVVVEQAVDGDPRVARTTITHGPASPTSPGAVRTTTSTIDLLGRVVSATELAGETIETTYDAAGNVSRQSITPPAGADAPALSFDFSYDAQSTLLLATSVNGVPAATVTRNPSGLISSIDYAGAATAAVGYAPSGRVDSLTINTGNPAYSRVIDEMSMTAAGRITGRSTTVTGTDASSIDVGYVYDSAGRLERATYAGDAQAVFEYRYAAQQASACGSSYAAGLDAQRTGGSRGGVDYVSCYDSRGRQVSTTDPLIAGTDGSADIEHDGLGRVTRVSGPRALAAQWGAGTELVRIDEIAPDGSGLVSTRWDSFGGSVVDKTLVTESGTATVRYAGAYVLDVSGGEVTGTAAIQYSLPGGASVQTAPGAKATLTIPGVDGSALVRVDVPSLASGTGPAPGAEPGVVGAYGPYGEPIVTPSIAGASPVPTYGWMASKGQETLPGTSSIVMMGDRPYHPGLGAFLAADPVVDSGDNLYGYTSGDPINAHDSSGRQEDVLMISAAVVGVAALFTSFGAGFLAGKFAVQERQFLARAATRLAYGGIAVAAVAAGGATYLAVQGQSADVGIAIGAAVGTALVATVGSTLFAKWGASRTSRLMVARARVEGERRILAQVGAGKIHPDVAPIAIDMVRGMPMATPREALDTVKGIIKGARKSSAQLDQTILLARKQQKLIQKAVQKSGLHVVEEVSEVASQL